MLLNVLYHLQAAGRRDIRNLMITLVIWICCFYLWSNKLYFLKSTRQSCHAKTDYHGCLCPSVLPSTSEKLTILGFKAETLHYDH